VTNLWSAKTRIGPVHFQAGRRKRRLNLALVFLYLICVVVHLFWWMISKWLILCWVGRETLTQSINLTSSVRALKGTRCTVACLQNSTYHIQSHNHVNSIIPQWSASGSHPCSTNTSTAHSSLRHIKLRQTILLLCLANCVELSAYRCTVYPSQATFKSRLKTHLFNIAFNDQPELWCWVTSSVPQDLWPWRITNWIIIIIYVKKLISLKHCVRSQITRLKQQKSFCDLEHGASLWI